MRIVLTELLIDRLNAERQRTGLAANALLATTPDIPPGLKPSTISSWFAKATKTADLEFFLFAIRAYARVQDPVANTKRPPAGAEDRIRISAEMRQTIRQVHETIPTWVLFGEGAPPGLTPVLMCRLTPKRKSGKRREKTIRKDVWEYLANLAQKRNCKALLRAKLAPDLIREDIAPPRERSPKARVPSYAGVEYTPISDALYGHFHAEIRRTLVSPKRLLQTLDDCPKGLDHRMVANWLSGKVQSLRAHCKVPRKGDGILLPGRKPGQCPLTGHITFKRSKGRKDGEYRPTLRAAGIMAFEASREHLQCDAALCQRIVQSYQVDEITPDPIEPPDDELVTRSASRQRVGQAFAPRGLSGYAICEDGITAVSFQGMELEFMALTRR